MNSRRTLLALLVGTLLIGGGILGVRALRSAGEAAAPGIGPEAEADPTDQGSHAPGSGVLPSASTGAPADRTSSNPESPSGDRSSLAQAGEAPAPFDLVLRRWPDGAPVADVEVEIYGRPTLPATRYRTDGKGRVHLGLGSTVEAVELHAMATGYETGQARLAPGLGPATLELRPLSGWFGRVFQPGGSPAAGVRVSGWWVERARPYAKEPDPKKEQLRAAFMKELKALGYIEDGPESASGSNSTNTEASQGEFVTARGLVAATAATNAQGYYYIKEIDAAIHGELALLVQDSSDASSEVLRVDLPSHATRLPDLHLHPLRRIQGVVVDSEGSPVPDAVVLPSLAQGWSPGLPSLRSDDRGRFSLGLPLEPIQLSVERVGYRLRSDRRGALESADGMWREVRRMAEELGTSKELFSSGYGSWQSHPLPRSRPVVLLDPFQSDVRLTLEGPLEGQVHVHRRVPRTTDLRPLSGARVRLSYGGLDARTLRAVTDGAGTAPMPLADADWQPVIVHVEADGFPPATQILPPDQTELWFVLAPVDEEESADEDEEPRLSGQVIGLGPDETARLVVYPAQQSWPRDPWWSGSTEPGGAFVIEKGRRTYRGTLVYVYAFVDDPADRRGGVSQAAELDGPDPIVFPLEPAAEADVRLGSFDVHTPHRMRVELAPFPDAKPEVHVEIDLTDAPAWSSEHPVSVPYGWAVDAIVERRTEGNAPFVDFLRRQPRQHRFQSLEHTFREWIPASEPSRLRFAQANGHLIVRPPELVDLSGTVTGIPPSAQPSAGAPPLRVAAVGSLGHWTCEVSSVGWFDFRGVPRGRYTLLLYSPPGGEGGLYLDGRGELHGSVGVVAPFSKLDIRLPWSEPEGEVPGEGR